jgi:hypothetical protein
MVRIRTLVPDALENHWITLIRLVGVVEHLLVTIWP